ncbi:erythromycin esterase family protein [Dactylosporangium siamense]|uniref:Erythromycin esterase n=1 Tax=Dactylosporangium siamense TaxID=685454 RepID=A0A919PUN6_9ACTN|nr:erythromycin esterase family protein [Dactylosporangium siamense]GIG48738.1 erythromycin esterase [Dactylosporangium siamense]
MTAGYAATVMDLLPGRPRLLALGEPTHGEDALLQLRNDLFRQLVEDEGYRTLTIESDCLMGLVVDGYVTSGAGGLDDVMERGFSHGWGAYQGNRDLVRWMRGYNDGRPGPEQVRFAGFDGPLEMAAAASPREVFAALHGYLAARVDAGLLPCTAATLDELIGEDGQWTDPAVMWDPAKSVGRSPDAVRLRLLADELVAALDEQTPQLIPESRESGDREGWNRARLYARTVTGLLRYHHWMADTSPDRLARLCAARDSMMAANLLAIEGPALAHGHNGHLQRVRSEMRMGGALLRWWGAGAIVSAHLGEQYGFVATAVGTIRHRGVDVPAPDTVEGMLYASPRQRRVVDARRFAGLELTARHSPWFGYAPLDPAHVDRADGIAFVREC